MTYQPLGKHKLAIRTWAEHARWKLFNPSDVPQLLPEEPSVSANALASKPVSELAESDATHLSSRGSQTSDEMVTVSSATFALAKAKLPELATPAFKQLLAQSLTTLSQRDWTAAKIALFLLALPVGGATAAYQWLAAVPDAPNCQSPNWSQAEFEQLQCLTARMQSGETQQLISGIRKLKAWPEQSPLHSVAQRLLEDWSLVIWSQAQSAYEAGEWENSARLIAEIPQDFEVWSQAQARSNLWQTVREQGDALYQRAEAAIKDQDWQKALNHAKELATLDNDYWRRQGLHELPTLIEERQAAVGKGDPVAQTTSKEPEAPLSPSAPIAQWMADPRSAKPHQGRAIPVVMSLSRPSVTQPGQRPPEFSAA